MSLRKWAARVLSIGVIAMVCLIVLLYAAVQTQQWLLRWRAERLMTDMHRIRLYQSTWADAQHLMHRWGAWGHYDGTCTATDCQYTITLTDAVYAARKGLSFRTWDWLSEHKAFLIYRWLDGRPATVVAIFTVHDGTVWRMVTYATVYVAPNVFSRDDPGYELIAEAKSRQALHEKKGDGWVLGSNDELAEHPYYKAGRPGGCTGCEDASVTYSTHASPEEIEHLTTYDFSCLTRFFGCTDVDQLLPAAKPWHLYRSDLEYADWEKLKKQTPKACDIQLWALARDAGTVLTVDVLSTAKGMGYYGAYQTAKVRLVAILKGKPPWPIGSELTAIPFRGEFQNPPFAVAEYFEPGRRYIVLPSEEFYGEPERYEDPSVIEMPRCSVQEDNAQNRTELEKGFAQNDDFQGQEPR
ncbi:MAG: hypothetical protein ACLQG3_03545 [Terracidiphilus sp.]